MALVEPLVGHLLSKYVETVNEGLEKIQKNALADAAFAVEFAGHPQGVQALKSCLSRSELTANTLETLSALLVSCDRTSSASVTRGKQRGARLNLVREFCSGESFSHIKKCLSALSDATLPTTMAALRFLGFAAASAPKLLLARFSNKMPLHYACFRQQLPYSQRRVRLARLEFMLKVAGSSQGTIATEMMSTHGFLTSMFEDAAEVLQEGSPQGLSAGKDALRLFQENFIMSVEISASQKRAVLLGQRNVFRLLVKALEFPPVAEDVAEVMYHVVTELTESPADYASSRVEATDGRGMPNFVVFFLLRQLRPTSSALASRIVLFILTTVPELIRPYFSRVSGHLADEGSGRQRVSATTTRIATLNLLTRVFLAPLPYHLRSRRATLEPVAAKADTFYTMSPRDVVDEICPPWVAEYVHRIINGASNLMTLALAVQLTEAALSRARAVLALVAEMHRAKADERKLRSQRAGSAAGAAADRLLEDADMEVFAGEDAQEEAEDFDAKVHTHLQAAMPRREEFWHRMTQQLHPILLSAFKNSQAGAAEGTAATNADEARKQQTKVEFVYQRMLLLMQSYTEVFGLRVSWLSAVPTFLPTFSAGRRGQPATASDAIITEALLSGNDLLCQWSPQSISAVCGLLVSALARAVSMPKLHHITMSNAKGGITEWPLLLSLLLWAVRQREASTEPRAEVLEALTWVARVVQWVVRSVTVRGTCELEEALLWVMEMRADAIPCFLHMLNSLLQRSLSKAADRVTQSLQGDEKGLLLAASHVFVAKTKEKSEQASSEPPGHAAPAAGKKGKGAHDRQARSGHDGAVLELWVENLRSSLAAYEGVMKRVASRWESREEVAATQVTRPLSRARAEQSAACGRVALSLEAADANPERVLHHRLIAKPTAEHQLRIFCATLQDPLHSLMSVDSATALLPENEAKLLAELEGVYGAEEPLTGGVQTGVLEKLSRPSLTVVAWSRMKSVCWWLSGRLLKELDAATAAHAGDSTSLTALATFSRKALRSIAHHEDDLAAASSDRRTTDTFAFLVLLLTLTRVQLSCGQASLLRKLALKPLDEGSMEALERTILAGYGGTLSCEDRTRYAIMLSLHYLRKIASAVLNSGDEKGRLAHTGESNNDGGEEKEEDDHTDSDDSENDDSDDETRGAEDRSAAGDDDAENEEVVRRKERVNRARCSSENSKGRTLRDAAVPTGFVRNRYLIQHHEPSPYTTPEADVLSFIVSSLTDAELRRMALVAPVRLHNNLRCATRSARAHSATDLLCSVFPELSHVEDVSVVQLNTTASESLLDQRYLLPLLHTVSALPDHRYRFLAARCTPVLIRALSCTSETLRHFAASALFTVTHVPQRGGPDGSSRGAGGVPARRIVSAFARLKMVQLAGKKQRSQRGGSGPHGSSHRGDFVPRLSGPLSAFLVLALEPLASFDDNLHNHFIRFLHEPEQAFSAAVPFAHWLSSFPLDAISAPLMLKEQEEAQRSSGLVTSSIAQSSAEEAMNDIRKHAPPQLAFMLRLIQFACGTESDAVALVQSECVERLKLLCDLVTSSAELRECFIACLMHLCQSSFAIASLLALHAARDSRRGETRTGGGLLEWLLGFLQQLNREYGTEVALYSEAVYTSALKLLRLLCSVVATYSTAAAASSPSAAVAIAQLGSRVQWQLQLLRGHLERIGLTAKETRDLLNEVVELWQTACTQMPSAASGKKLSAVSSSRRAAAENTDNPLQEEPERTGANRKRTRANEDAARKPAQTKAGRKKPRVKAA